MNIKRLLFNILLLLLMGSTVVAKTDYRYSYIPKQVYRTQVFPLTILANTDEKKSDLKFSFESSGAQPVNKMPVKDINGGNTFYTFYFKALENDTTTAPVTITDSEQTVTLSGKYIPVAELNSTEQKNFCGLIATDCKIVASQVSAFDDKNNLVSITIKATEANPQELTAPESIESGIEKITQNGSTVMVEYYFVIPSTKMSVVFSYFNTLQHKFIEKSISTDFKHKPVAAQENLNPIDSSFDKLKKYGLATLGLFFLLMFWKRKDFFYLVLLTLDLIILVTIFMPHEKICIEEGAQLYILPTNTSTISTQINREFHTNILNRRGEYSKIEYDKGLIGWIKDEDVCKD